MWSKHVAHDSVTPGRDILTIEMGRGRVAVG